MTKVVKAERRLSNFNFEGEGSHVALVGKHQGGAANGYHTLITKATEQVEKAEVEVKISVEAFLRTFFGLYWDEAATIAYLFGIDQDYYTDDFPFEDFNSIGASEVTLLKSAGKVEKAKESLGEFVKTLNSEEVKTLKAFADGFNIKYEDYTMSVEVQKALDAQKLEHDAKIAELTKAATDATEALATINKAKADEISEAVIKTAIEFGATDEVAKALAVVSQTDAGIVVQDALEKALKSVKELQDKMDELTEKESGLSGEASEDENIVSGLRKALEKLTK